MKFISTILILFSITLSYADQLAVLDEAQAIKTVNFIKEHPHVVLWCACCDNDIPQYIKVSKPEYQSGRIVTDMYEVVLHGINKEGDSVITSIDLAYAHVIKEDMAYCLGLELGFDCDPCTPAFKFKIPKIKDPNIRMKLVEMDFTNDEAKKIHLSYKWSKLKSDPDITINAIENWTSAIAFSKDEKYIIAAGGYFEKKSGLKKYEIANGEIVHNYIGHNQQVETIAVSKNGKYMISSDHTGKVIIWDIETDKQLYVYEDAHTDWVEGLCFSHNNKYAASVSRDHYIKIWELEKGKLVRKFRNNFESISSVAFATDNKKLIVGGIGIKEDIAIYDLETGKEIGSIDLHTRWSKSIDVSPDGNYFASAGDCDNNAKIVNINSNAVFQTAVSPAGCVNKVNYSPDGRYLAVSALWGIYIWDIKSNSIVFQTKSHTMPVESVVISNSGKYLATSGRDAKIHIWKINE